MIIHAVTDKAHAGSQMQTIPASNLKERKQDVLRIHKENMKIVKRLADMNCTQNILMASPRAEASYSPNTHSNRSFSESKSKTPSHTINYRYLKNTMASEARFS
jgi:hypothetical protein